LKESDVTENQTKQKVSRARVLQSRIKFDEKTYEYDDSFVPADTANPMEVHTTFEMLESLQRDKNITLDAKVIGVNSHGEQSMRTLNKEEFITAFRENESFDGSIDGSSSNIVGGSDFIPLLGGPFYKNLYYYDNIRMHSQAFYAWNHDPIGKAIVNITKNFTLGKGFKVVSKNKKAMAMWEAFAKANNIEEQIDYLSDELAIYGEVMLWWLPGKETFITYDLKKSEIPTGIIPRVRLIDVSCITEIVTYPEDITHKLFYVWLAPTQMQMYTQADQLKGIPPQPSMKYIYRQIPADQIDHVKINCVSNEKRGRSDFYPVLGYMKRLRDSVEYSMIAQQKQSAWAIDTTIIGDQTDIDNYVQSQNALGAKAPAGSEFVHSDQVKREFLSNQAGHSGQHESFEWNLSMIAAGVQMPVSYLGTHLSGGQTIGSSVIATEPVVKKFEMRQQVLRKSIIQMWGRVMKWANIQADCEIIFPEIYTQDRSSKLKDLGIAGAQGWLSKRRIAEMAAKEFGIIDYDYDSESQEITQAGGTDEIEVNPLTGAPKVASTDSSNRLNAQDKKDIKNERS